MMNKVQSPKSKIQNLSSRPPIVVVLGHVDHGKSSLLDFIRKTNVVGREAGGITQSIGAYEIVHTQTDTNKTQTEADSPHKSALSPQKSAKKITFIDTPGHEAFSKMRQRGAKVADLAILVVAADDGVKPQTKESIDILKETQTPFVVAVSKIDKPGADIERVKNELTQAGVLLEGSGGNVSWQQICSKTGQGINELLDLILLAAEIENLTYNPEAGASGIIIESKMESQRGIVATVIIKNGTLKINDEIFTLSAKGKIKILENFLGGRVEELIPSSPALVVGFETLPQTGEEFFTESRIGSNFSQISQIFTPAVASSIREIRGQISENSRVLNLILKADVSGSLEALSETIRALPKKEVGLEIIEASVGDVTDGDVKLAQSTKSIIIGFRVRTSKPAENLARAQDVKIIVSEVIYELVKAIELEIAGSGLPKIIAELEVLALFSKKGKKQLIGGRVIGGIIRNKAKLEVKRGEEIIGKGRILNLQQQKQDTAQVEERKECGIMFESNVEIKIGDRLIIKS